MGRDLGITETIVWTCVALSLLFADIVIRWQDLRSMRPVTSQHARWYLSLGYPANQTASSRSMM